MTVVPAACPNLSKASPPQAADMSPLVVWVIAALGALPLAAHTLFWSGADCF